MKVVSRFFASLSVSAADKAAPEPEQRWTFGKCLWAILVFGGLVATGLLVVKRIQYYAQRPKYTLFSTTRQDSLRFPIILISTFGIEEIDSCNEAFQVQHLLHNGLGDPNDEMDLEGYVMEMPADGEEACQTIKLCAGGADSMCIAKRANGVAMPRIFVLAELNFTMLPPDIAMSGVGVWITMYLPNDDKKFAPGGPVLFSGAQLLYASPGRSIEASYTLKQKRIKRLEDCVEVGSAEKYFGFDYTEGLCTQKCIMERNKHKGCNMSYDEVLYSDEVVPSQILEYCSSPDSSANGAEQSKVVKECTDLCKPPCDRLVLEKTRISHERRIMDEEVADFVIGIEYASLEVEEIEEKYVFEDPTSYLTDLGGTLGVIVGGCLLTLLELLNFGLLELVGLCSLAKQKNKTTAVKPIKRHRKAEADY